MRDYLQLSLLALVTAQVFGEWALWGDWSDCSATCGDGMRVRSRTCDEHLANQTLCEGPEHEESPCNVMIHCPNDKAGRAERQRAKIKEEHGETAEDGTADDADDATWEGEGETLEEEYQGEGHGGHSAPHDEDDRYDYSADDNSGCEFREATPGVEGEDDILEEETGERWSAGEEGEEGGQQGRRRLYSADDSPDRDASECRDDDAQQNDAQDSHQREQANGNEDQAANEGGAKEEPGPDGQDNGGDKQEGDGQNGDDNSGHQEEEGRRNSKAKGSEEREGSHQDDRRGSIAEDEEQNQEAENEDASAGEMEDEDDGDNGEEEEDEKSGGKRRKRTAQDEEEDAEEEDKDEEEEKIKKKKRKKKKKKKKKKKEDTGDAASSDQRENVKNEPDGARSSSHQGLMTGLPQKDGSVGATSSGRGKYSAKPKKDAEFTEHLKHTNESAIHAIKEEAIVASASPLAQASGSLPSRDGQDSARVQPRPTSQTQVAPSSLLSGAGGAALSQVEEKVVAATSSPTETAPAHSMKTSSTTDNDNSLSSRTCDITSSSLAQSSLTSNESNSSDGESTEESDQDDMQQSSGSSDFTSSSGLSSEASSGEETDIEDFTSEDEPQIDASAYNPQRPDMQEEPAPPIVAQASGSTQEQGRDHPVTNPECDVKLTGDPSGHPPS